ASLGQTAPVHGSRSPRGQCTPARARRRPYRCRGFLPNPPKRYTSGLRQSRPAVLTEPPPCRHPCRYATPPPPPTLRTSHNSIGVHNTDCVITSQSFIICDIRSICIEK